MYIYTYVYFCDFNEAIKPQHTADQYHVGVPVPLHLADVPDLAVFQQHTGVDVDEQRSLYTSSNRHSISQPKGERIQKQKKISHQTIKISMPLNSGVNKNNSNNNNKTQLSAMPQMGVVCQF